MTSSTDWRWVPTTTSPNRSRWRNWYCGYRQYYDDRASLPNTTATSGSVMMSRSICQSQRPTRRGDADIYPPRDGHAAIPKRQSGSTGVARRTVGKVWGYANNLDIETRTVDIHIAKLRRKIETDAAQPQYLVTVRGAGYRAGGRGLTMLRRSLAGLNHTSCACGCWCFFLALAIPTAVLLRPDLQPVEMGSLSPAPGTGRGTGRAH